MTSIAIAALSLSLVPAAAGAQTPSPKPSPTPSAAPQAATPPAPEGYTYNSEGRRDPFLNLLGTGNEPRNMGARKEGPSGLMVGEISVNGILQGRAGLIAMIQGPDKKTYVVHQGDKFLDGTIKTVTPQGLIIIQEVNDPLSLVKQREIKKLLRSLEDAKG